MEIQGDTILLEIVRVSQTRNGGWLKNNLRVTFPSSAFNLPGSTRKYRLIATCHHRGSLHSGHWFTRMRGTGSKWYEIDDLASHHREVQQSGKGDNSVVVFLLQAEDCYDYKSW